VRPDLLARRPGAYAEARGHPTIYQASNAEYLGRTTPRRVLLLPNGRVSERALSKVRGVEQGHACVERRASPSNRPAVDSGRMWRYSGSSMAGIN
jgi:hypothetical protein